MEHRCSAMLFRGLPPDKPLRAAARQARVSGNRTIDGEALFEPDKSKAELC